VKKKTFAGGKSPATKNRPLIIGKTLTLASIKRYLSHKNIDRPHE
jgi:hypothetical protein